MPTENSFPHIRSPHQFSPERIEKVMIAKANEIHSEATFLHGELNRSVNRFRSRIERTEKVFISSFNFKRDHTRIRNYNRSNIQVVRRNRCDHKIFCRRDYNWSVATE